METFRDNSAALAEYRIVPSYIRDDIDEPDTTLELFGRRFGTPVLGAPMTGARTNMNDAIDEFQLALDLL
ncbi:MAG: alpha-hydroxy-acid oxidizing protein, partial [Planctomycetes bacterium]|nr:alpha-hydroxy-acid oxidizing protein [Planctomycetota bacterium]